MIPRVIISIKQLKSLNCRRFTRKNFCLFCITFYVQFKLFLHHLNILLKLPKMNLSMHFSISRHYRLSLSLIDTFVFIPNATRNYWINKNQSSAGQLIKFPQNVSCESETMKMRLLRPKCEAFSDYIVLIFLRNSTVLKKLEKIYKTKYFQITSYIIIIC